MNGVNLEQFQFEFDLTWMAFFQNGRGGTYTRYGGRNDHDPDTFMTKASLLETMRQVLKLHAVGAVQRTSRFEPAPDGVSTPEEISTMAGMMAKRSESCIHCHDVKIARLKHDYERGQLNKKSIFTYPAPDHFGLHLNPDRQRQVARVDSGSPAELAGLRAGDLLVSSQGQRLLTYGDLTRVLEFVPPSGQLPLMVDRQGVATSVTVELPRTWRESEKYGWRSSTGAIGPGAGFWGIPLNDKQRETAGIPRDKLAVRINFIWADHAKKAGVRHGDLLVEIDGQTHRMNTRQVHGHLQLHRDFGDTIKLKVRRKDVEDLVTLTMTLPSAPLE